MYQRVLLLFYLVLFPAALLAQEPSAIHLTEKDGLPDIEFYDLFTDSKGFVWLAADKGLFKYDGKNFINYNHPEKRGLSVFNISEDKKGRIWCKNISGQIFYVENDTMKLFVDLNLGNHGESIQIEFQEDKIILIGFYVYRIIDFETREVLYGEADLKSPFGGSSFQYKGKRYVNRKNTLLDITNPNNWILEFNHALLSKFNDANEYFNYQDDVFIYRNRTTGNELLLLDIESKKIVPITLPTELSRSRWSKVFSRGDQIWFCTSDGVFTFRYKNGALTYNNNFLSDYFPTDVTQDRDNNLWISTLDAGVFVIPNINIKKYRLPSDVSNITSLKRYKEQSLAIGSFNGAVGVYNPSSEDYQLLDKASAKVSEILYFKERDALIASNDLGGFILSKGNKTQVKEFTNFKGASQISDTTFIVAAYNSGLIFTLLQEPPWILFNRFNYKRAYSCHYDRVNKNYYVGNTDHLRRYDSLFNEKTILYKGKSIFALDITQTANNTIWVTTFKHGILGIRNDSVIASYNKNNGLPTNNTSSLKAQKEYLWAISQEGVVCINTVTNEVKVLTQQDGIPTFKINEISTIGNEVFFASNEGLFSTDIEKAFVERSAPDLTINGVSIADKDTLVMDDYLLPYDMNRVKVSFSSNSFQANKNIRYEYQLNGSSEEWTQLQTGVGDVTFSNLADGDYLFKVRARNSYNNKISEPELIKFRIQSPFWERWWFMVLVVATALLLAAVYFKTFQNRREKEKNLEVAKLQLNNQLTSLKLENLRSQMNPHFIFNALNSIQEYIILNQKDLASDYLGKFADLVRAYLKHSAKGSISLQEEIDCLEMYLELEKLRFEDKLNYKISKSQELFSEEIAIPTMLVQPYVENSIKHGFLHKKEQCELTISFAHSEDYKKIICVITDNGIGRKRANELQTKRNHESFATKANNDRLQMINQGKDKKVGVTITDLLDYNNNPSGTKVVILIPFETI